MLIESEVETEWIKVPQDSHLVFVGRDAVCVGKDCHLIFHNLIRNDELVYSANNYENGDGIQCYAGQRNVPVVAFAEKVLNPRLMIITYPGFVKLNIIKNCAPEGYMTMIFSEQAFLITLSALPTFELLLFNWRTAEKMLSIATGVEHPNQYLSCSIHSPNIIVQYTEYKSNFVLWNIYSSYKNCVAIRHDVEMPNKDQIVSCVWSPEGTLYVLNIVGCVYQVTQEYTLEIIIYGGTSFGGNKPCFCWYKGGFLILLTNIDIKYFKKISGSWYEDWDVTPVKLKKMLPCSGKDILIAWSDKSEIMELDFKKHCFVVRKSFDTTSEFFCLIYPTCNHFAALCPRNNSRIRIWECSRGNQVGNIFIVGFIRTIISNPIYPYIAAGLNDGALILLNCHNPEHPKILTRFNLYHQEISKIVFNDKGNIIITASLELGLFFIIRGVPGTTMEILRFIDYRRRTLDIAVNDDEKYINLYILVAIDKCLSYSQRIVVKSISKSSKRIKKRKYISQKYKFTNLQIINSDVMLVKVFNSKIICTLCIVKKYIKILQEIHTGHYLRYFILNSNLNHVYTCGYDGLIIIRSSDLSKIVGALLPHHRYNGGVQNVLVDPFMRYVISYSQKMHVMVCTKFLDKTIDDRVIKESHKKLIDMRYMFSEICPTIGFESNDEKIPYETYLESKHRELIKQEQLQYAKERQAIMEEFLVLKEEVVSLLEKNLNGPELEKIDILEFYQHTLLRQYKEEMNKKKCEWIVKYYKDLIRAQDEVWLTMKKKFFDSMETIGTLIKGMFSKFSCESYSILPGILKLYPKYVEIFRELEDTLRVGDRFKPWDIAPDFVTLQKIEKPPIMQIKSESVRILEALEEDKDLEAQASSIGVDIASYPSNTVSEFIVPSKSLYEQDEMHTSSQIIMQIRLIENDQEKLRRLFNEKYNEMKQVKVKDMNVIYEKNRRLRFILSELNIHGLEVEDPRWYNSENVENIITVKASEIGITPYISPSEQAILDWQAAEAERIRLLLLADDFREKALIKMMDGVLEVRWEDTLKRDIPKPKCMLEKDPFTFNEEDLRAVRDYEEKVAFLNSERQMYKSMLEAEYTKTSEQVREIIKKFNSRLREILMFKIKIESARMQQSLIIQRLQNKSVVYLRKRKEEDQIIEDIKDNENLVTDIQLKLLELNDACIECRYVGETLFAKERLLERNFKRDFQDYSALVQEQGYKLYRKLPKMSIKGINYVFLLNELASCCTSQEKSQNLTQDCLDFLRSLDNLDQYVGLPTTIDENMYKIICKHRRLKIENELKVKANTIEQNDIDIAIQAFEKYLASEKDVGVKLGISLVDKREALLIFMHDKKMQIVIKKGLVEIPLNGNISDFENVIMIHRKDVENINEIILKAGARKLKVMNNKMTHRRSIIKKEWEHNKLKMEIEDLRNQLYIIDHMKVTKEIQQYLRQRAKGELYDKGMLTLDQEIESKKKAYEKIINERHTAINEINKQIKKYKKKNKILDQQIADINIDVCEKEVSRDLQFERSHQQILKNRMTSIVKRSKLVKQIQDQHSEILVLQTELELLRLKTYPTLKFKTLF